jgi:hypothetical protein
MSLFKKKKKEPIYITPLKSYTTPSKSYTRTCVDCGEDIDDLPSSYIRCQSCFSSSSRSSGSYSGTATFAQVRLLMQLKDEGFADDDVYFKGLSIREASEMIDEALKKKNRKRY